jgi:hypothetical protein
MPLKNAGEGGWMSDVKTGSEMIDCSSETSLVTTAMSLHKNRLLLSVLIVFSTEFLFFQDKRILTYM